MILSMLRWELLVFLVNGLITVFTAYLVYSLCLQMTTNLELASFLAYLAGMTYSYFANKTITFNYSKSTTFILIIKFIVLHTFIGSAFVLVNSNLMYYLAQNKSYEFTAFLIAVFVSSVLNFCGLKYLVFTNKFTSKKKLPENPK